MQSHLPARHMADSHQVAIIPLGQDEALREHYINYFGSLRFGRILEDLDMFAAWVAFTHTTDVNDPNAKYPFSLVTALVDRIVYTGTRAVLDADIWLTGQVTWVGQSSMEITMKVEQSMYGSASTTSGRACGSGNDNGELVEKLHARFVFVARHPTTGGKAFVNPLELVNDEERKIFHEGEERMLRRKLKTSQSLLKTAPNETERNVIHDIFLKTIDPNSSSYRVRLKPENCVWMSDTRLKNVILCNPDKRNVHFKIFGGYLMRQAFELAWTAVMLHCNARPAIIAIHDILFRKPVDIGAILILTSKIVYTEDVKVQVRVHASVINPKDHSFDTTNIFQFTFQLEHPMRSVLPMTYSEAMLYLDGKRHFDLHKIAT